MRTALALLVLLLLAAPAAAADYSPRGLKDEWRYIDETDEAKAAKLLDKLLKRHRGERRAARLVETLRKGRPYARGLDGKKTLSLACADKLDRQFTWILPKRYSPKKPTGVLVFLHGAIRQGPPGGGHHEAEMFGATVDDLGFIKVGPSTYSGHEWGETAVRELVHRALEAVKVRFNVDEDRVFLAGDSDGGRGTYLLAETEATWIAAAIPVIGAPGNVTRFVNLRNLPFLAINGGKDSIFKPDRVRESVERMQAAGISVDFRMIEDSPHDPRLILREKEAVVEFVGKHPREPLPKKVEWQFDPAKKGYEAGFPANTFRWIRIEEAGETASKHAFSDFGGIIRSDLARIEAELVGENRVRVRTHRVKRFTVLVSDEMFDLEKPIRIDLNGSTAFLAKVGCDTKAILEEARLFNDRRLVFANRITIDVDDPPMKAGTGD